VPEMKRPIWRRRKAQNRPGRGGVISHGGEADRQNGDPRSATRAHDEE
jgi:hypothetical protein